MTTQSIMTDQMLLRLLRVCAHEAAQLTSGLDWISYALSNPAQFRERSDESIGYMSRDIAAIGAQLCLLSSSVKYFATELVPHKTEFEVIGELLLKLPDTYRRHEAEKNLRFRIRKDRFPPPIYADRRLIEHLIYNLLNNAVKYCYRGTNIELDCQETTESGEACHVISVTDYGMEFDAIELFPLGSRGTKMAARYEGLGIGLFLADKIARAHGGQIKPSSSEISRFNVPVIEAYLSPKVKKSDALIRELCTELSRLRTSGEFDAVVAQHFPGRPVYENPTEEEDVSVSIREPTYKVTISVVLPNRKD